MVGATPTRLAVLDMFRSRLTEANRAMNLVGDSTLADFWGRHFVDSAQLLWVEPSALVWADLGSGAGLPGLVLAILGVTEVHLIESDQRKAAFLREAKRVTAAANVTIHAARAEKIAPFKADIVVARAVAPLNQLLYIAESFLTSHSQCLFLKGKAAEGELTEARMNWRMNAETLPSRADPVGIILRLGAVSRETSAAAS